MKAARLWGGAGPALLAELFLVALAFLSSPDPAPTSAKRTECGQEFFLESFFKNKDLYDAAFARAERAPVPGVRAGIVPHHFLARDLMAAFFKGLAGPGVSQVILVGPDHFRSLSGTDLAFATTLRPWRTPFGVLEPDRHLIQALLGADTAALRDRVFMREHAVWVLAPFVKKALPQARIIPLVVRSSTDYQRLRELGAALRRLADPGAVLVVSSDFCHGGLDDEAARLDVESIAVLNSLNMSNLARLHCDCRPCLAVLLGFLGDEEWAFTLLDRLTSRDLGAPGEEPLTSYVSGYFGGSGQQAGARVLFVGDLFLDRGIRRVAEDQGYGFLLRKIRDLLLASDLVVANLEGPITQKPSVSSEHGPGDPDHYRFTFAPGALKTLADHRINLVNLGNNHVLDFGPWGLEQTREHLALSGICYFGTPGTPGEKSVKKVIGGLRWAFVSFNQFADQDEGPTLKEITRLKSEADLVVVYAHWGQEYSLTPSPRMRERAHAFIDRGADLVIGSHPHVVQEKEEYRGKMIYYSLGNFVFDQYFRRDTSRGLAVRVTVQPPSRPELEEIPLILERRGQTLAGASRP